MTQTYPVTSHAHPQPGDTGGWSLTRHQERVLGLLELFNTPTYITHLYSLTVCLAKSMLHT